jgi:4-amino-4-deoxy-L-arabinose transferase-like glycosyltransferase
MHPATPATGKPASLLSAVHRWHALWSRRHAAAELTHGWRAGMLVAAMAAVALLPNLGGPALWDEDEPLNAGCSLAMWQTGDWVVPTFNGRLRVEKPPLVNWSHLVGFWVAGPGETGARLPSAVLTTGTCVLTWRLGSILFGGTVGVWSGVVLATAVWTAVTGRAATPDASLGFLTTLALVIAASGWKHAGSGLARHAASGLARHAAVEGRSELSLTTSVRLGAACGLAMLAKGPVGLVLPLAAVLLHATLMPPGAGDDRLRRLAVAARVRSVRPLAILLATLAVAGPWYAAVSIRTAGTWPREFFLVHNAGRFTGTMEGHSGFAALYYPAVLLVGMFPWSCGWIPVIGRVVSAVRGPDAGGMRLLAAWAAVWIGGFSLSATKLPGYIWPAYPAVAVMTGYVLAQWTARPTSGGAADPTQPGLRWMDRWMTLGWMSLVTGGVAIACGLAWAVPQHRVLAASGLLPAAGGIVCWILHARGSRLEACRSWAVTGAATIVALAAVAAGTIGGTGGSRELVARLAAESPGRPVAAVSPAPSVAFYASRLLGGPLPCLEDPAAVAGFFAAHPDGRLIIDERRLGDMAAALPADCRVLGGATTPLRPRRLVILGAAPAPPPATRAPRPDPSVPQEGTCPQKGT